MLSPENQSRWIEKAEMLSQKALEREVVTENPKAVPQKRIRPLTSERSELRLSISRELEEKIAAVKDLVGGNLEEALEKVLSEYLERHHPLKKAQRAQLVARRVANVTRTVPAPVKHAVNRRDGYRCTARNPDGSRCEERRWLHLHHQKLFSRGGGHAEDNLVTLCSAHHRQHHQRA